MKITKSKLRQLIKEELNEISAYDITGADIAFGLAHEAAGAVVNTQTVKGELSTLSREDVNMLDKDIRSAVKDIILTYFKPDVEASEETDAEEPPMDLYSDYDEDPIKALEKRRAELKKQIVGGNPDAMDAFKEWQNLGSKIAKLKSGK